MSQVISLPVSSIPEPDRRSLDNLLGHTLAADQQVCVMVFSPSKVADDATRLAAMENIRRTLDQVDRHRVAHEISESEVGAAVDEATDQVRPRPG
jgi:hypothetical protein